MIDTTVEEPIPLALAARETPNRRGDRGVSVATVWRWMSRGVHGVKLETILIGGTRMTSREALQRFFAASTAAANGELVTHSTPKQQLASFRAAESYLDKAGF